MTIDESKPKISILIPSLNNEDFIAKCIESVINQSLKDIEIICIDAGSTDNTLKILEDYSNKDSRIKIIHSDKRSYGYQMNLGLKESNGLYVGIVESDDYIDENMYEKLFSLSDLDADIVKGTFFHVYDEDDEIELVVDWGKKELVDVTEPFTIYDQERFLDAHPSIWAGIYRNDFLKENNIKFVEEKGAGWVDNPFFYETAFAAKKIIYRSIPLYYYRETNPNSSSNSLEDFSIPIRRMMDNLDIVDKYNCADEKVLYVVYLRVFAYIDNISRRNDFDKYASDVRELIHQMMLRLDENIILDRFDLNRQDTYFNYISTINQIDTNEKMINISNSEFNNIKKENDYLYYRISSLKNQLSVSEENKNKFVSKNRKLKENNKKLKNRNRKLKDNYKKLKTKNSKLNKELNVIEESKYSKKIKNKSRSLKRFIKKNVLHRYNVLFIPSDNNRTSGAFISMVNLIVNLRTKYNNLNIFVIVPHKGNGEELLKSMNINYIVINSQDWVIPLSKSDDKSTLKEIKKKKRTNKKAISKIRNFIRKHNINLVHINTTYSYVGAKAALQENIPFVWHLREFLEEDQSNTLWDREKGNKLINKADKIVAISDSIYKKYESTFDQGRLVKIYNGIDANKFYKPDKEIFSKEKLIFIMVGGFEYYKGQIEFAKACAKLFSEGFHNFEVWFIGTGKDEVRSEVSLILSSVGMIDSVKFLGYKSNVEDYFSKSDISFTCAKSEAFGRTTVEAMLSGNLVIGADSAGTKELINHKETGLLYDQGNSDDLYEKMCFAIKNQDLSKEIAEKGREYMFNNMTAEINADNVYNLYKDLF